MKGFHLRPFLTRFYATTALFECVFAYAVYNILFTNNGLSVQQVSWLFAWWAACSIVFEVPSGGLADRWSRRKMLIIAPLAKAGCFALWVVADGSFWLYAAGFFLWSIGEAFLSGTAEAMLYDASVLGERREDYEEFLGRNRMWSYVANGVAFVSGGFIAHANMELAIVVSVIPLLVSAWFAWRLPELPSIEPVHEIRYWGTLRDAAREVVAHPLLRYLFGVAVAVSIVMGLEEYDQYYYELVGLPIWAFGIAGLAWSFLNGLGASVAHRIKSSSWMLVTLPLVAGALLVVAAWFPSMPMVVVMTVGSCLTAPVEVLVMGKIQHAISGASRATVTSVCGLFMSVFIVVVNPVFGVIADRWGVAAIYGAAGVFLIVCAGWILFVRGRIAPVPVDG